MEKKLIYGFACLFAVVLCGAIGIWKGLQGFAFGWYVLGSACPIFLFGAVICWVSYFREKKIEQEHTRSEQSERDRAQAELEKSNMDAAFMKIFEKDRDKNE